MTLLIIEDEAEERTRFLEYAKTREDIIFIGSTNSSSKGYEILLEKKPEGIILDLELHKGKGSGMEFLIMLKDAGLEWKPIIVITTNASSSIVYNTVRSLGADYIFHKLQSGYSQRSVIDSMLLFRSLMMDNPHMDEVDDIDGNEGDLALGENPESRLARLIELELDAIGMGRNYKGRDYLESAVMILVNDSKAKALKLVAMQFGLTYSSIIRAIQTAIDNTWYDGDPEVLLKHYSAHVGSRKGTPSPSEFLYYYSEKIKKMARP
jgi:CheY-like chemotaxis protein